MKPIVFEPMDMPTAESLLKEAKMILDQLGIDFFLRHGTCLGAVRDQAFIPWDDDLDIGSVIGLHGLTEKKVYETAEAFKENGYNMKVIDSDLHLSVDLKKFGIQMDWTCYRIIDDSIYQWPVIKIPVSLHVNLKPIKFLSVDVLKSGLEPEGYLELLVHLGEFFYLRLGPGHKCIVVDVEKLRAIPIDHGVDLAPQMGILLRRRK